MTETKGIGESARVRRQKCKEKNLAGKMKFRVCRGREPMNKPRKKFREGGNQVEGDYKIKNRGSKCSRRRRGSKGNMYVIQF